MKNLHLVLVLFSIVSMFTSFGVYDVDATKYDNNGNAKGCYNGNEKVKEKNPHCDNGGSAPPTACGSDPNDCDGDGIPNSEDACPDFKNINSIRGYPDHDGDGKMDSKDSTPCG